ncbi:hypothetical protein D1007_49397 [Hordeum vulgare]|nr:hypothetical protein D1007_49397 [Hordeum vulgare]
MSGAERLQCMRRVSSMGPVKLETNLEVEDGCAPLPALQHQPNSVLLLVIFVSYCEDFMGVRPSVVLFHHFFSLWFTATGQHSACVSFVDDAGAGAHLKGRKKVEGYQHHWVFMDVRQESPLLATPSGPPEQTSRWSHRKLIDPRAGLSWSE